jgi:hypothetical protein
MSACADIRNGTYPFYQVCLLDRLKVNKKASGRLKDLNDLNNLP